ncbi:MAG: 2-amino-3,7-dideoxy-D-threo-hept-6-ulosonate synthase [Candidatus Bathyarchaeia archaeon]
MIIGKSRRLRRIFRGDGRTVIVPMDHGVTVGPVQGLKDMRSIIDKLNRGGVDAILIHKGIAKNIDVDKAGLIIHMSGSTSIGPDPLWKCQVCTVTEALKLGADAVSIHINVGAPREHEMLIKLGRVAEACDDFGVPLLAMMYPRGPTIKSEHAPEVVGHAARLGAELGADIVKTNYTGSMESFREVVSSCPVPVVIAGGPKMESMSELFNMVYDSMRAGASGISIGRNVFQHERPESMVKALVAIVHEGASVQRALEIVSEKY